MYLGMSGAEEKRELESLNKSSQTAQISPNLALQIDTQMENNTEETQPRPPHEAFFFVLAYLPVMELLVVSEVCRSLRDAVKIDVLPWLNVIVDSPLNSRLSNDILIKVTSRSNGKLRSLALIKCEKITDGGLQQVVEQNPLINKLYVPACTGLTPEGVVRAVKTLTKCCSNLEGVQINGIYNIKNLHLQIIQSCLQNNLAQHPILFHDFRNFSTRNLKENNRPIDVDVCPRCNDIRMVFDCPRESCSMRKHCRGCYFCIPRCVECGGCVDYEELEEAACDDVLCLACWLQLPKCNCCNKPYCRPHSNLCWNAAGSSGFVCDVCHEEFIKTRWNPE